MAKIMESKKRMGIIIGIIILFILICCIAFSIISRNGSKKSSNENTTNDEQVTEEPTDDQSNKEEFNVNLTPVIMDEENLEEIKNAMNKYTDTTKYVGTWEIDKDTYEYKDGIYDIISNGWYTSNASAMKMVFK